MQGTIIRSQSGFLTVQTEGGPLICQLRGRLKKGRRLGDVATIGDRVEVTVLDDSTGVIEEILPRTRVFSRLAPTPRGAYQQILIANPDQAGFVFACARPDPHLGMLDRFLVIAEKQGIPAFIVANKVDLVGETQAEELFGRYVPLGYPVLFTSAKKEIGIDALHNQLKNRITLLSGPSGVGKSSLLNSIQPGLGLAVRQVSETTSKGKHTTVVRQLFPLLDGGYVADTPGLKALALWDIEAEELDGYFPEMRALVMHCAFSNCTHVHEPGCAVRKAVESGQVHPDRYQAYLRMRFGDEE